MNCAPMRKTIGRVRLLSTAAFTSPSRGHLFSSEIEGKDYCPRVRSELLCGENPLGNKEIWESREMS